MRKFLTFMNSLSMKLLTLSFITGCLAYYGVFERWGLLPVLTLGLLSTFLWIASVNIESSNYYKCLKELKENSREQKIRTTWPEIQHDLAEIGFSRRIARLRTKLKKLFISDPEPLKPEDVLAKTKAKKD